MDFYFFWLGIFDIISVVFSKIFGDGIFNLIEILDFVNVVNMVFYGYDD